jgi:acetolactate synthase-1/2/3 large subunit
MIKLSDYVMNFVASLGVRHVFMVPGGGAMHLNDSLGSCRQLEYVCNLHEQASAIAAEAYAKVVNDLGVALVTTGPGGTNAVTGVAGAWLDSTPCLFLSGQVKRSDLMGTLGIRQLGVQEVDIVSIVTPITKYAVTVTAPTSIRYHLEKAVYLARTGRPGPVWIDIPLDVQAAPLAPDSLEAFAPLQAAPPAELAEQVAQAIELLNQAERPIVLAGNGIRLAGAQEDFFRLIERLGLPLLTTWLAMDLVPEEHELYFGRPGPVAPRGANFALQNSDFLLTIGARLDLVVTAYAHDTFARAAKKVMVDIDRAEIAKMKTPIDVPVCADAGDFIREFLRQIDAVQRHDRSAWIERCQRWKTAYPLMLPEFRERQDGVSTYLFSDVLSDEMEAGELVVSGSSGAGIEIFLLMLKIKPRQRVLVTTALGAMGFGLPAAIGACLAGGRRRTVCVDGDGSFQLNIQELETVARLDLPIKFFVLNNQGYSSIRTSQNRWFGRLAGADATSGLTLPDLLKVGAAYGVPIAQIKDSTNLGAQIRAILDTPGPVVCDVIVPPDEPRIPSLASAQRPDGSLISRPLEDLWPFLDRHEFRANMIIPPLDE